VVHVQPVGGDVGHFYEVSLLARAIRLSHSSIRRRAPIWSKRARGLTERHICAGVAEGGEAAALAEQGVSLFDQLRKLLPTVCGIRVEGGGPGVVAGALRLDRLDDDEGVLLVGFANSSAGLSVRVRLVKFQGLAVGRGGVACSGRSCISWSGICSRWCGC
jgi:hypothetical protein